MHKDTQLPSLKSHFCPVYHFLKLIYQPLGKQGFLIQKLNFFTKSIKKNCKPSFTWKTKNIQLKAVLKNFKPMSEPLF